MKLQNKKKQKAGAAVLILALALSAPVSVQAAETGGSRLELTVTVPERPDAELTMPEGAVSLKDLSLPEGWHWENPDQKPTPGTTEAFTAQYGDTNQKFTVMVKTPPEIPEDQSETTDETDQTDETETADQSETTNQNNGKGSKSAAGAKTGDDTNLLGWMLALGSSMALMGGMVILRLRKKEKRS